MLFFKYKEKQRKYSKAIRLSGTFTTHNSQSINLQALKATGEAGEHSSARFLNPLLLISFIYLTLNQPVPVILFHVLPLLLMQLFDRHYWAAKVFWQEVMVDDGGWAFGGEVQEIQKVGVYERFHEAHHLVDEGDCVDDVDLLETAWMRVLGKNTR